MRELRRASASCSRQGAVFRTRLPFSRHLRIHDPGAGSLVSEPVVGVLQGAVRKRRKHEGDEKRIRVPAFNERIAWTVTLAVVMLR